MSFDNKSPFKATARAAVASVLVLTGGMMASAAGHDEIAALGATVSDTAEGEALLAQLEAAFGTETATASGNVTIPGVEAGTAAGAGSAFASLTYTDGKRGSDGSAALGFGMGDATETVAAQFTLNLTSLDGLGDDGYVGLKFSKKVSGAGSTPIYAGISFSQLAGWGAAKTNKATTTVALTGFSTFANTATMWTVGYGTNVTKRGTEGGAFAGVGFGLTENFGIGFSTNSEYVSAGFNYKIPGVEGLSISVGGTDLFDDEGLQATNVGINYSFSTSSLFGGN